MPLLCRLADLPTSARARQLIEQCLQLRCDAAPFLTVNRRELGKNFVAACGQPQLHLPAVLLPLLLLHQLFLDEALHQAHRAVVLNLDPLGQLADGDEPVIRREAFDGE